jgi:hypothetical protein
MVIENPPLLTRDDFASAMLSAARKLGLEGTFLRLVAAELPDDSWLSACTLSDGGDGALLAAAEHLCLDDCPGTPAHCLTALKIEEVVSKKMGRPYTVVSAAPEAGSLTLRLRPFE